MRIVGWLDVVLIVNPPCPVPFHLPPPDGHTSDQLGPPAYHQIYNIIIIIIHFLMERFSHADLFITSGNSDFHKGE